MDETTESVREEAPEQGAPERKGLPAWAKSLFWALAGAAVIGAVWFAYAAGQRSAGPTEDGPPLEATSTAQASESTVSLEATTAAGEQAGTEVASGGSASTAGGSGTGSSSSGSGSGSGSSSSGSSGSGTSLSPLTPKPLVPQTPSLKPKVPVLLWKTIVTLNGTGNLTHTLIPTANATIRHRITIKSQSGGMMKVMFIKSGPTGWDKIIWWSGLSADLKYTGQTVNVSSGPTYKTVVTAPSTCTWVIQIQERN